MSGFLAGFGSASRTSSLHARDWDLCCADSLTPASPERGWVIRIRGVLRTPSEAVSTQALA